MSISEEKKSVKALKCNDHLANERTFLAWIRTSIGIIALGFVIEKFAFFLRQLAFILSKTNAPEELQMSSPSPGFSAMLGIFLVGIGGLIGILSFFKYKQVQKQIDNDNYHPPLLLDVMLSLLVLLVGLFLVIYLVHRFT